MSRIYRVQRLGRLWYFTVIRYCLYLAFVFFCLWLLCTFKCLSLQCNSEIEYPLILTLRGPVVLLVCGFVRRDNLLAWPELFTNLYELKSRILGGAEYIHFERIHRVSRFDGFSWNFIRKFQGYWKTKLFREIWIFHIFFPWRPFTQQVLHVFCYFNFRCEYQDN